MILEIIVNTTPITTLTKAPLPQLFAFSGNDSCHTKYNIKPTSGNKNPRNANPPEGASPLLTREFSELDCCIDAELPAATALPHLEQNSAPSFNSFPQFEQYDIKSPV